MKKENPITFFYERYPCKQLKQLVCRFTSACMKTFVSRNDVMKTDPARITCVLVANQNSDSGDCEEQLPSTDSQPTAGKLSACS